MKHLFHRYAFLYVSFELYVHDRLLLLQALKLALLLLASILAVMVNFDFRLTCYVLPSGYLGV